MKKRTSRKKILKAVGYAGWRKQHRSHINGERGIKNIFRRQY